MFDFKDKGRGGGGEQVHSTGASRSSSPGCHVRGDQDLVDAGLELGQVGKALFLGKVERRLLFR